MDYHERPRFEPCVVHVISRDGLVSSRRHRLENVRLATTPTRASWACWLFETTSPKEDLRVSEEGNHQDYEAGKLGSHENCGLTPLQEVIWFPAEDNNEDDIPIIVSKLFTVRASDKKPSYDIDIFPSEAHTPPSPRVRRSSRRRRSESGNHTAIGFGL